MSDEVSGGVTRAAGVFGVRILSAVLVFGLQVLLARLMDLDEYGAYVTLWTWLIALGSFAAIGLAESSVRFLPRYRARGREDQVRRFWRFGLMAVLAASSALAAAAIVAALLVGTETTAGLMVLFVALGLPFLALEYYLEGVARSFGWFQLTTVPVYIVRPLLIGAGCVGLAAAGVEMTVATVATVVVGAMAVVSGAVAVAVARRLARPVPPLRTGAPVRGLWLRASLPLLVLSGLEDLLTYADVLILSLLMPPADVAIYFAAARTLALAHFAYFAIYLISGRTFALALAGDKADRLQDSVLEASRLTFWSTFLALVVTLAAAPLLLAALGEEFRDGYPLMVILAAGLLARGVAGQAGELLIVAGLQKQALRLAACMLAGNVCLTLALVPVLGTYGAALGASLAMAARAAALVILVRRSAGLRTVSLSLPRLRAEAA